MRTANLNALYSRSSHQRHLVCRTSCQTCYCYVYFSEEAHVTHDAGLLCTACTDEPNGRVTTLSLFCGACGDMLCPVQGHTSSAQRHAELCTDCYAVQHREKRVQYTKPVGVQEHCAICLGEQSVQSSVQVQCEHVFHKQCISQWLKKCDTCPLCRQNVCQIN